MKMGVWMAREGGYISAHDAAIGQFAAARVERHGGDIARGNPAADAAHAENR